MTKTQHTNAWMSDFYEITSAFNGCPLAGRLWNTPADAEAFRQTLPDAHLWTVSHVRGWVLNGEPR